MNIQPPVQISICNLPGTYKGSNGIAPATVPDICLTPCGTASVPIPYPNIATSMNLAKGTTTVKFKNNAMAIRGTEYSRSNGDEAGLNKGVASGSNMSKFAFLMFAPTVKLNGKNACCGTHSGTSNNKNTVSL